MEEIKKLKLPDRHDSKLGANNNAGFFSTCSNSLLRIIKAFNLNLRTPDVDFSQAFNLYKDNLSENAYPHWFDFNPNINLPPKKIHNFQWYNIYKNFNYYPEIKPLIDRWFSPSSNVLDRQSFFLNKYKIFPANTLSLYFRGTDKRKEMWSTSYENFISPVEEVLKIHPEINRVFLQSDQQEFIDFAAAKLSKFNCFTIDEIKRTTGKIGLHFSAKKNKMDSATDFFAAVLIISSSKFSIYNTGNVSKWISIYRQGTHNTIQFLRGRCIDNFSPEQIN